MRLPVGLDAKRKPFGGQVYVDQRTADPIEAAKSFTYDGLLTEIHAKGENGHAGFGQNGESFCTFRVARFPSGLIQLDHLYCRYADTFEYLNCL